jgi:hypothetical protein
MAELKRVELKSLTLKSPLEAWILGEQQSGKMSKSDAYLLPEIGRAVDIIAGAVVAYPYGIYRGEAEFTEQNKLDGWESLLWSITTDWLVFGAWYVLLERNQFGVLKPRRLLPTSIEPKYNQATGQVTAFERTTQAGRVILPADQVVYDHVPNPFAELGAGPSALDRAMNAAGIGDSQAKMLKSYYERGAPMTLFSYSGVIDQSEGKALTDWWNNIIRRGQQAYKAVLMRGDVKPQVFGSNARDAFTPEIMAWVRQEICIAFGIPVSVMESSAANFATAESDRAVLQENTVRPLINRMFDAWNGQYYGKQGLELWAEHDATNAASVAFLNKAQAISTILGRPAITLSEGRALLNLDPLPEQELPQQPQPPQPEPQREDAPKPEQDDRPAEPERKSFAELRKKALAAFDAGAPVRVGLPFDDDLAACKSKGEIRTLFERNWPVEQPTMSEAVEALKLAAQVVQGVGKSNQATSG